MPGSFEPCFLLQGNTKADLLGKEGDFLDLRDLQLFEHEKLSREVTDLSESLRRGFLGSS